MKEQKTKKSWRSKGSNPYSGVKSSPVGSSSNSQSARYLFNDGSVYDWHVGSKKVVTSLMGGNCYEAIVQLPVGMDNPSIPM